MSLGTRRVLVVDDDADIREALQIVLELEGYEVRTAANGRDAFAVLRGPAPFRADLIVLDLMMPVMTGYAFRAEQLRDPVLAGTPVLLLTGYGDAAKHGAKLQAEAMSKPVDLVTLQTAVRRLTARSSA